MSALATALLAELTDADLDALADRLAPRLACRLQAVVPESDGWLDAKAAASYLGITTNTLHKLTAARAIPFEQDGPGCKCWFRRSGLDRWREGDNVREVRQSGARNASRLLPRHRNNAR